MSTIKPDAEHKRIILFLKNGLPDSESGLITDIEKLYAILTNLVRNAIKYTEKGYVEFGYRLIQLNPGSSDNGKRNWSFI